ncbi:MAG: hypothetical protein AAGA80_08000, partial [Cyanobacteria bacterium P01_F01_bin.143]
MKSLLGSQSMTIAVLATILLPQQALSNHSWKLGKWRGQSFYEGAEASALSLGIGGLQAEIKEARTLNLKPSDISYQNGYLQANIDNQQLTVKINHKIVKEAIRVVEKNDTLVFQVSIDQTALGRNEYIDETMQGTKIGELLLEGDIGFAHIVQGEVPLPEPKPIHPYETMLWLLRYDAEYRKLPTQWENPPRSWPQIYLRFDPRIPGLISTEFKPQVIFKSLYDQVSEVDEQVQSLGERPYLPLVKDVKKRPLAYRKISPSLELAASITATLGLLEAACPKPGSCKHLYSQTKINSKDSEDKIDEQKVEQDSGTRFDEYRLIAEWNQIIYREILSRLVFSSDNPEKAWAAAYDSVRLAIQKEKRADNLDWIAREKEKSAEKLKEPKEITKLKQEAKNLKAQAKSLRKQASPFKELAKQQFLNNPIPNFPPLLAASAVVFAWNGEKITAEKQLSQAIQLSNYPKDSDEVLERVKVLEMGLYIVSFINRIDSGDLMLARSIYERIEPLLNSVITDIYDEVDEYLQDCLVNLKNCPERELRKKEFFLSSVPSNIKISKSNIAWLHGRFNYLIGIQIEEAESKKDRLRFLSFYVSKLGVWHRWKLIRLEADLRKRLGM